MARNARQFLSVIALLAIGALLGQAPIIVQAASDYVLSTVDGKVGIGTTEPSEKLHVVGNIRTSGRIGVGTGGAPAAQMHIGAFGLPPDGYAFRMGGSGRFAIDSDQGTVGGRVIVTEEGKFGIGTGAQEPEAQLHIGAYGFSDKDYAFRMGGSGRFAIDSDQGTLGGRLIVTQDGKVGIGTSKPTAKLDVGGSLIVTDDGNVGIGTNAPTSKLDVDGSLNFDGQKVCQIVKPGNISDSIIVPASWTEGTCKSYMKVAAVTGYNMICIFSDGRISKATAGNKPHPNCGW